MSTRHRPMLLSALFALLLSSLLVACGQQAAPSTSSPSASAKSVSIGLGYVPDIQFAPFYVAQSKGYYKAAGLNVTFHHGVVTDLIGSMVAGKNDFVFAGGDELLEARDKGVQAIDVGTIFQKYPVSLIVPQNSPVKTLADIKGHTIGVPGAYGSTYTGLLALLYKAGLSLSDIQLKSIGFTQVSALIGHHVDSVVGYSNNEPLQLSQHGFPVRTFNVSDYQPLVSNGIITTENTYHSEPQVVSSFVQATLKGLKDVIANPTEAVNISKAYIPGLDVAQAQTVLKATIPVFQPSGSTPLGVSDSATWESMAQFLVSQKLIHPVNNLSQVYTNQTVGQ